MKKRPSIPSIPSAYEPHSNYNGPSSSSSSSSSQNDEDEEETFQCQEDFETESPYHSDYSPRRNELAYQNNEDYLDLVQELEETLQNRSRNRVHRAMREFERRSKYNKPLDRPIINYDETSESEEPLIQRIYYLTDRKKKCTNPFCRKKKDDEEFHEVDKSSTLTHRRRGSKSPKKPRKNTTKDKTRWQMDQKTGEWFKVDDISRRKKPRSPSPRRGFRQNDCSCCNRVHR